MKEVGPGSDSENNTSRKRKKRKGRTSFIGTKQRQRTLELKRRKASCEVGVVAQSEPSETREDVQGRAWRQHCEIWSLDLEALDEAEASFDTMEGIQNVGHLAEAAESGDEGIQCTLSKFEGMGVEEGTVLNSLAEEPFGTERFLIFLFDFKC